MATSGVFNNRQSIQETTALYSSGGNSLCEKDAVCCRVWRRFYEFVKSLNSGLFSWGVCGLTFLIGLAIIVVGFVVPSSSIPGGKELVIVGSCILAASVLVASCTIAWALIGPFCRREHARLPQ